MLKRLRRKLVAITMLLAGSVLVWVLGSTLWTTWSTQRDLINETLTRAMANKLDVTLPLGGLSADGSAEGGGDGSADWQELGRVRTPLELVLPVVGPTDEAPVDGDDGGDSGEAAGRGGSSVGARGRRARETSLPTLVLDVTADGTLTETSIAAIGATSNLLSRYQEVVSDALASGEDGSGSLAGLHVAWRRSTLVGDGGATYRVAIVDTTVLDSAFAEQVKSDAVITAGALVALFLVAWWLSGWALGPVARAWDEQRRFVADASHELKTPLAVIMANTQILEGEQALPAESRRWVASTAEEAGHMKGLVNDLLELARADESAAAGTAGTLRREDVDLSELVDSAVLEFDAVAFERGCTLEAAIVPGLHVTGDAEWLGRVVRILVDNACKYADAGTSVRVGLHREGGRVELLVNNRGGVIGPEDLPHVFERFYRSDKARTRGTGGFGLGLAIAKSIVEAHGGRISCTSDAARGTTFTVLL